MVCLVGLCFMVGVGVCVYKPVGWVPLVLTAFCWIADCLLVYGLGCLCLSGYRVFEFGFVLLIVVGCWVITLQMFDFVVLGLID